MSRDLRRTGMRISAIIVVLAGALAIWARLPGSPVSLAKQAYERGDWNRAADALREEVSADRGKTANPEALRIYARTLARLERDDAASLIYNKRLDAAKLEPEDRFLMGLMHARAGRVDLAFNVWKEAEQQGANHPELLEDLSRLSIGMQQMDQAAEAARRLARQPGWEAKGDFLLADIQEFIDNPPGVVAAARAALDREPTARGAVRDAAYYRKLLARNLLRLGRPAEARIPLEAMLTGSGAPTPGEKSDPEAYWLLSRAYLQEGRIPDAANALARSGSYGAANRMKPEPSPFVGSAVCAPCHRPQDRAYQGTRHTRSFHHGPGLLDLPLPDRPLADPDDPKVTHTIARKDQKIEVQTRAADRVFQTVVTYAFGTRERSVTMIGRDEEKNDRALRLSHYHSADGSGWGRTSGDVGHSETIEDIRGQKIDVRDGVVKCLYCHTTRSRDYRDPPPEGGPGPEAADSGIGCERCHGPGGNHVAAIKHDFTDRAIVNVSGAPAAMINAQCADCHIVGLPSQIKSAPEDPKYVRSTGVTMTVSRCYTESNGGMSCLTCHDPHREAEHAAAFYEAKCLSCHSRQAAAPVGRGAICPVNPAKDCLGCHMPKVPVPALHTTLTDHYIRVHRSNEPKK
jgi:tetratricopeptide (TPR) repeat protein